MVLYFDIVFLINLIMNYIILYLVAYILNLKKDFFNMLMASILGCLFLVELFSDRFMILRGLPAKMIISAVMVYISYRPCNFREFMKTLGFFYLISFMMGGSVLAFFYLINVKEDFFAKNLIINNISVPWWILLFSASILLIFFRFIWPFLYKILLRDKMTANITVVLDDKAVNFPALVDTGNDLFDPISKYPVIIVELDAMKSILEEEVQDILMNGKEEGFANLVEHISNSKWANRIRLIPFESIGRSNGLMVGYKPDNITIECDDKKIKTSKVVIGIYPKVISSDGTYRGLLNPELLNE